MKDTLWHINWGDGDTTFVIAPSKEEAIAKMSDGKDMVNSVVRLDHPYQLIFKAGKQQGIIEWGDDLVAKGKEAGIGKVVKWIEENYPIGTPKWQAQKKTWGIKDE